MSQKVIFTLGHSTRSLEDLKDILKKYKINQVIDIRKIPYSRYNPQFSKETFSQYLRNRKIGYRHMQGLTGLRRPNKISINKGLNNKSFRAFADYMQTEEFRKNLQKLVYLSTKKNIVLLCAEAVPFRCHRSLIADALVARGIDVKHIYSISNLKNHQIRPYAKLENSKVYYP